MKIAPFGGYKSGRNRARTYDLICVSVMACCYMRKISNIHTVFVLS